MHHFHLQRVKNFLGRGKPLPSIPLHTDEGFQWGTTSQWVAVGNPVVRMASPDSIPGSLLPLNRSPYVSKRGYAYEYYVGAVRHSSYKTLNC